jgi:hypothetical protein
MNQKIARQQIDEMGPRVLAAMRKGPEELIRVTAELAPRLREIRPHLSPPEQAGVDRILERLRRLDG